MIEQRLKDLRKTQRSNYDEWRQGYTRTKTEAKIKSTYKKMFKLEEQLKAEKVKEELNTVKRERNVKIKEALEDREKRYAFIKSINEDFNIELEREYDNKFNPIPTE